MPTQARRDACTSALVHTLYDADIVPGLPTPHTTMLFGRWRCGQPELDLMLGIQDLCPKVPEEWQRQARAQPAPGRAATAAAPAHA
eukprot:67576-Chlamydomonas_euryale.AAC.1